MVRRIKAQEHYTVEEAALLGASFLDESSYDTLITEDADVLKPDGTPLLLFRKGAISPEACAAAYPNLRDAAGNADNRGLAGGVVDTDKTSYNEEVVVTKEGLTRYKGIKADGTLSNTQRANKVRSGIVGYFNRTSRFPYCRTTAYNLHHPERFTAALPFIKEVSEAFRHLAPQRYAAQLAAIEETHPDFYIPGTAFTTVTVNKNWQTAVHQDKGDYREGFGVLTAFTGGTFTGCFFVYPRYRVAVDMRTTDVLVGDVHCWHGNTPFRPTGKFERISCVFYYRDGMQKCGSAAEELEIVKNRQRGPL